MYLSKLLFAVSICTFFACTQEIAKEKPLLKQRFQFSPTAPSSGEMKGVIELGGYGFNSFIIRVDSSKNWQLESAQYGVSNVYSEEVTEDYIKEGFENYRKFMIEKNVDPSNIHFITSSTASKNKKVQAISTVLENNGHKVHTVTAEKEAEFVMIATLPKNFVNQGFVVDIGTGNTKISWTERDSLITLETYGSGYFLNGVKDSDVQSEIKNLLSKLPKEKSKMCFIIGGVPFRLAKDIRIESERYTILNPPDSYNFPEDKQMNAGLNIYKSIATTTNSEHYIFDWESNFSIGFLLDLE